MSADEQLNRDLDRSVEGYLVDLTARTPGARLVRQDGLLLAIGAVPSPTIVNTLLPIEPAIDVSAVERAVRVYRELNHGVGIWTRDHRDAALAGDLEARAFRPLINLPGMVLRHRPASEPAPDGAVIRRVETDADRRRWLEANARGFAEDDSDREAMGSAFGRLEGLVGGPIAGFYAEADGTPAAASMVFVDSATRIGVIGWVGTDPAFRRRGLGRAVTLAATLAGFDLGARLVSLQASPMGLPVYTKMGFETVTGYRLWFPPR